MLPVGLGDVVPELPLALIGLLRNVSIGAEGRTPNKRHKRHFEGAVN